MKTGGFVRITIPQYCINQNGSTLCPSRNTYSYTCSASNKLTCDSKHLYKQITEAHLVYFRDPISVIHVTCHLKIMPSFRASGNHRIIQAAAMLY